MGTELYPAVIDKFRINSTTGKRKGTAFKLPHSGLLFQKEIDMFNREGRSCRLRFENFAIIRSVSAERFGC